MQWLSSTATETNFPLSAGDLKIALCVSSAASGEDKTIDACSKSCTVIFVPFWWCPASDECINLHTDIPFASSDCIWSFIKEIRGWMTKTMKFVRLRLMISFTSWSCSSSPKVWSRRTLKISERSEGQQLINNWFARTSWLCYKHIPTLQQT